MIYWLWLLCIKESRNASVGNENETRVKLKKAGWSTQVETKAAGLPQSKSWRNQAAPVLWRITVNSEPSSTLLATVTLPP